MANRKPNRHPSPAPHEITPGFTRIVGPNKPKPAIGISPLVLESEIAICLREGYDFGGSLAHLTDRQADHVLYDVLQEICAFTGQHVGLQHTMFAAFLSGAEDILKATFERSEDKQDLRRTIFTGARMQRELTLALLNLNDEDRASLLKCLPGVNTWQKGLIGAYAATRLTKGLARRGFRTYLPDVYHDALRMLDLAVEPARDRPGLLIQVSSRGPKTDLRLVDPSTPLSREDRRFISCMSEFPERDRHVLIQATICMRGFPDVDPFSEDIDNEVRSLASRIHIRPAS